MRRGVAGKARRAHAPPSESSGSRPMTRRTRRRRAGSTRRMFELSLSHKKRHESLGLRKGSEEVVEVTTIVQRLGTLRQRCGRASSRARASTGGGPVTALASRGLFRQSTNCVLRCVTASHSSFLRPPRRCPRCVLCACILPPWRSSSASRAALFLSLGAPARRGTRVPQGGTLRRVCHRHRLRSSAPPRRRYPPPNRAGRQQEGSAAAEQQRLV